jgi:hypothetical protein
VPTPKEIPFRRHHPALVPVSQLDSTLTIVRSLRLVSRLPRRLLRRLLRLIGLVGWVEWRPRCVHARRTRGVNTRGTSGVRRVTLSHLAEFAVSKSTILLTLAAFVAARGKWYVRFSRSTSAPLVQAVALRRLLSANTLPVLLQSRHASISSTTATVLVFSTIFKRLDTATFSLAASRRQITASCVTSWRGCLCFRVRRRRNGFCCPCIQRLRLCVCRRWHGGIVGSGPGLRERNRCDAGGRSYEDSEVTSNHLELDGSIRSKLECRR